jgi:predicted PurR-regulated permease PerM
MILAVPLLVIIKIACENFEPLRPVAALLGEIKTAKKKKDSSEPEEKV